MNTFENLSFSIFVNTDAVAADLVVVVIIVVFIVFVVIYVQELNPVYYLDLLHISSASIHLSIHVCMPDLYNGFY